MHTSAAGPNTTEGQPAANEEEKMQHCPLCNTEMAWYAADAHVNECLDALNALSE